MTNIKEIIEAQRRLDDLSGAKKAQKILLEMTDTYALREAKLHRSDLFGASNAQKILREEIDKTNRSIIDQHRKSLEAIVGDSLRNSYQQSLRDAEQSLRQLYSDNLRGIKEVTAQNLKSLVGDTFSQLSSDIIGARMKEDFDQLRKSLLSPFHTPNSELLKDYEQAIKAATLSSVGAFSKTLLEHEHLKNDNLLRQFSTSLIGYDNFANYTLTQLRDAATEPIASALKGSLSLANEQVLRSTNVVQSYIENLNTFDLDKSNLFFDREFSGVNRYRVQKQELLRRDDIEENEDYDSLIIKSPSAISFDLIVSCLKFVGMCNETSQTTKGDTIFTLTNSVWSYSFELLQTVPTNKEKFAEIIDYLYFILIEGAGGKFLRFVDYGDGKHFGYFTNTEPEVEVIWKIKHLRNKWLRHDIEHGTDSDIRKSYQLRKEALEWFGMQKVPQSKDEFVFLYNNLMLKVEEFLKFLLDRVSKFTN